MFRGCNWCGGVFAEWVFGLKMDWVFGLIKCVFWVVKIGAGVGKIGAGFRVVLGSFSGWLGWVFWNAGVFSVGLPALFTSLVRGENNLSPVSLITSNVVPQPWVKMDRVPLPKELSKEGGTPSRGGVFWGGKIGIFWGVEADEEEEYSSNNATSREDGRSGGADW